MKTSRLTRFVALPGGIDIQTALAAAEANVEAYRETALDLIDQAIDSLMAAGEDAEPAVVARLAESVRALAGMFGLSILEQSAKGLCDMVRALVERGAWDRPAVWINIQALKLIRQHGDNPNLHKMLDALRRLSARATGT